MLAEPLRPADPDLFRGHTALPPGLGQPVRLCLVLPHQRDPGPRCLDLAARRSGLLGEEGRRLFVIIRLGDLRKKPPPPVSGANRVYDRIEDSSLGTPGSDRRRP